MKRKYKVGHCCNTHGKNLLEVQVRTDKPLENKREHGKLEILLGLHWSWSRIFTSHISYLVFTIFIFFYFGSAVPCRCLAVGAIHRDICATPIFLSFCSFFLFYFLGPRLLLWRLCHVVDFQKHVSQPTLWSVLTKHPRNWRKGMTVLSSYPHSLPTRLDCDWTAHARSVVLLANSRTIHVSLMGGSGTDKKAALCQCCHVNPHSSFVVFFAWEDTHEPLSSCFYY